MSGYLDDTLAFVGLIDKEGALLEVNASALAASRKWRRTWSAGILGMPGYRRRCSRSGALKGIDRACCRWRDVRSDVVVSAADSALMDVDFMRHRSATLWASRCWCHLAWISLNATGGEAQCAVDGKDQSAVDESACRRPSRGRRTARDGDPATFVRRLSDRIDGLAGSQDLLIKNKWRGVEISELIQAQLAIFRDLNRYARPSRRPHANPPAAAPGDGHGVT